MSGGRKQLNKNQQFKRQKVRDARTIRAEAAGSNELSESGGMLKVQEFIGSREYEIRLVVQEYFNRCRGNCVDVLLRTM